MPKQYHISEDGEPRVCRATKACPIGGEHFADPQAAREAYEHQQEILALYHDPQAPALSSLVDPAQFGSMITKGYISERLHPEDPSLRVYSYTPKTQFAGMWTEETLLARGLILRVPEDSPEFRRLKDDDAAEAGEKVFGQAVVHSRGLSKFFTVEQMSEGDWTNVKLVDDDENVTIEEHAPIDFNAPAFVADKLNGALGVMYLGPDGKAQVATKGSFGSPEAGIATGILNSKYDSEALGQWLGREGRGKTPLFEIITPQREHPVDYGDMEDVVLLGTVENRSGHWTPATADHPLTNHGFAVAEQKEVASLGEALALPYQPNTEGLVVTSTNSAGQQRMFKVKPPEYHELRRSFYAMESQKPADLYHLLSEDARANLFKLKESDVSVQLDGPLQRFEAKARKRTYEQIVKPAQETRVQVNRALDDFLRDNRLKADDPLALRVLGKSGEREHGGLKGFMLQALRDRQDGTSRLDNSIVQKLLSGKKK